MAEDNKDNSQKTEEPSERQLEEARKKGQVPSSKEVVSFVIFLTSTLLIYFILKPSGAKFLLLVDQYITTPHLISVDSLNIKSIAKEIILILLLLISAPLLINLAAVVLSYFLQHNGFVFSTKVLNFDLSKLSLIKGLAKLFSLRSIVELLKGILKIALVGVAAYFAVKSQIKDMESAFYLQFDAAASLALQIAIKMMVTVCFVMFLISIIDFLYQRFEHRKGLRMSHQDLKDEYKKMEGDPEIRAKRRSRRRELLEKFNINDVIKSDVIVTNPTHYAIALEYDPNTMQAPKIVAKGSDLMAFEIRKIAKEHFIPIVRNPALARALYDHSDLGDFVPLEHYKAVAEVISYVMSMNKNSRIATVLKKTQKNK